MERTRRYDRVAMALHWLTALAVLLLIVMGLTMTNLPKSSLWAFRLYQWHKSVGITVLLLTALRLAWRLLHRPPALPSGMADWEKRAAHGTHILLYALLFGLPLTGWATVSASPYNIPTVLYGLVPWPHIAYFANLADKAAVEERLGDIHGTGAWIMIGLLVLHAAAALRHHLILKDDILARMLPLKSAPADGSPPARG